MKDSHEQSRPHAHAEHVAQVQGGARDPVCGMSVDPATAPQRAEHAGQPYFFCSARCREKFVADPASFVKAAPAPAEAAADVIYTCPMHPEVR